MYIDAETQRSAAHFTPRPSPRVSHIPQAVAAQVGLAWCPQSGVVSHLCVVTMVLELIEMMTQLLLDLLDLLVLVVVVVGIVDGGSCCC